MLSKQVKSSCCKASVVRFGGRRRKCRQCGGTWRIRQKSRGRKPFRLRYQYLNKVFDEGLQLRQVVTTRNVSKGAIRKRFEKVLNRFVETPRVIKLPKDKLILIIDARWHKFKGRNWTLYCFALKSVNKNEALILDPRSLTRKRKRGSLGENH
jgi:transposase-like protein